MKIIKLIATAISVFSIYLLLNSFTINDKSFTTVESLKTKFYSLGYNKGFSKKINDTAQLSMSPDWDKSIQIKKGDDNYTYVPITELVIIHSLEKINIVRKKPKYEYLIVKESKNDLVYYKAILESKDAINDFTGKIMLSNLSDGRNYVTQLVNGVFKENNVKKRDDICYYFICEYYSTCFGTWWFSTTYAYGSCQCPSDGISGCYIPPAYSGCGTGGVWWLSSSESYEVECSE